MLPKRVFTLAFGLLCALMAGNCTTKAGERLTLVEPENVCMVNNTHFGQPQIPVVVDGKTYYGCCENCKKTLATDGSARTGIDPFSKNKVDKAIAVIGANKNNKAYYFENKQNLEAFRIK